MVSKKEILKNLRKYSPEEIADAVRNGVVSLYELGRYTEGAFTPLLKRRVKELLEAKPTSTVGKANENIPEIKDSTVAKESTVEETSIPDEYGILDIAEDSPLPTEPEPELKPRVEPRTTPARNGAKPGMFRNPFSFTGRIRRTEYGLSLLISYLLNVLISVLIKDDLLFAVLARGVNLPFKIVLLIILILFIWFSLAQGAKRCHDIGVSGWYQLIPFYGFWLLFKKGEVGANKYGNSPK